MAKARAIAGLVEADTFREAAARAIEVRAAEVFDHRDGVLDTSDVEHVHDMRVATRRLRAAMEIFAVCFPSKEHKRLLKEVKALADVLGERRDRDVAIDALRRAAAELTATERPGLKHLQDELRAEQERANEELAAALADLDRGGLRERLLAHAVKVRPA
jgi:CHAD domain-containing protein